MRRFGQFCWHGLRYVTGAVWNFVLWLLWIGLVALAVTQVWVATKNELVVPAFLLRRVERQLADEGVNIVFDRATFDPTGRILVREPRVRLPEFADPVVTARAAYVTLNPWMLVVGRLEVREIQVVDGTVAVPAMLSPSGRSDPIVRDLHAVVLPGDSELVLRHISGRVGALTVSIHGSLTLPHGQTRRSGDVARDIRTRFREFCRGAVDFTSRLDAFEEPSLDLEVTASPTRGGIVNAFLAARGFRLETPFVAELGQFRARTRFPLFGDAPAMSRLDVSADDVRLPKAVEIRHMTAAARGRLRPAELRVQPVEFEIAAESVITPDGAADDVSATIRPLPLPRLRGDVVGRVLGAPLQVHGETDLKSGAGTFAFAGEVAPQVLDAISARTRVDVRKYFQFEHAEIEAGTAELAAGWKFTRATAAVRLKNIDADGITMEEGRARVEVDPHRLWAPEAFARIGENFASGSYEHEFSSRKFRFLLDGRLRPLALTGWFHDWWSDFFRRFDFPTEPPLASVDVRGIWREGHETSVFVFADADQPTILDTKLQRVRTRLFIRPGFYDGLELYARDGDGGVGQGTFLLTTDLDEGKWRRFEVDARSTLALEVPRHMTGELGEPLLQPFALARAPAIKVSGRFDGPAADGPRHRQLDLEARTTGEFKFHDFPLEDVAFTAALRDDDLAVDNISAKFAGGIARAHAKVWTAGKDRRLRFDAAVNDASLGLAVGAVQQFAARRQGREAPAPNKFVAEKINVRLDATASAEGIYGEPLSFHGDGNVAMRGPQIGELPLFGPLSELLKFTALRFTTAQATFKLNGAKLEFPEVSLRGANSAIDAHGEFALDRRQLDFRAKVFPFQESGSVIKTVVGAVLTPISNALEVKLTGTLEKPDWAFVIGPTNLIRSLTPDTPAKPDASPAVARDNGTAGEKPAEPTPANPPKASAPAKND